jgi:hypothetical protein
MQVMYKLLIPLVLAGIHGAALPQNAATLMVGSVEHTLVKTKSGCGVYQITAMTRTTNRTFEWQGACINGVAEGPGELLSRTESAAFTIESRQNSYYRAGLPIGYLKTVISNRFREQTAYARDSVQQSWSYSFNGQTIGGSGFGVVLPADAASSTVVSEPKFESFAATVVGPADFRRGTDRMTAITQTVALELINCKLSADLPACQGKADQAAAVATGARFTSEGAGDVKAFQAWRKSLTYHDCPNRSAAEGCEKLAYDKAEPVRQEILEFIRMTKPQVEAEIQKSRKLIAGK